VKALERLSRAWRLLIEPPGKRYRWKVDALGVFKAGPRDA
jgi:hypothetical protein